VGVYPHRLNTLVPQQLLDVASVSAVLQKVGGKRMTQRVHGRLFLLPCPLPLRFKDPLYLAGQNVFPYLYSNPLYLVPQERANPSGGRPPDIPESPPAPPRKELYSGPSSPSLALHESDAQYPVRAERRPCPYLRLLFYHEATDESIATQTSHD